MVHRMFAGAVAWSAATAISLGAVLTPGTDAPDSAMEGPVSTADRHVVFIDLDGLDVRLFEGEHDHHLENMPNIKGMIDGGSFGFGTGSFSSWSNSSRTSMATGALPAVHRNTGYYFNRDTGTAVNQERYIEPDVETIAQAMKRQDVTAAYIQWYIVENYGASYGDSDALYVQPGGRCSSRADQVEAILTGEPINSGGTEIVYGEIPELIMMYCDDPDSFLHGTGFDDPELADVLSYVDAQVGRVYDAVVEAGIEDKTTFIVTSDHGMREWYIPILDDMIDAIAQTGLTPEVVPGGGQPADDTDVVVVSVPRTADIHPVGDADTRQNERAVKDAIESVEGIEAVYDRNHLRRLGASDKLGNMVVEPASPYHLSTNDDGVVRASHGGLAEAEMPIVLYGDGIREGATLRGNLSITDLAPTVSALLDVEPPATAEGRPLRQAFTRR